MWYLQIWYHDADDDGLDHDGWWHFDTHQQLVAFYSHWVRAHHHVRVSDVFEVFEPNPAAVSGGA